ncbi:hypothetical protein BsWGS_14352 [Bradybaena similaris]
MCSAPKLTFSFLIALNSQVNLVLNWFWRFLGSKHGWHDIHTHITHQESVGPHKIWGYQHVPPLVHTKYGATCTQHWSTQNMGPPVPSIGPHKIWGYLYPKSVHTKYGASCIQHWSTQNMGLPVP